jgi:hypothetical protein
VCVRAFFQPRFAGHGLQTEVVMMCSAAVHDSLAMREAAIETVQRVYDANE